MNFIPHAFGIMALLTWISSFQFKEKHRILLFQILANIFYAFQYIMLGLFSAGFMNIVSVFRCYVFMKDSKKNKETPFTVLLLFLFAFFILEMIYWKTLLDILPIIAAIIFTISSWQKSTTTIRVSCIFAALIFAVYNSIVGTYVALIGNIFEVTSAIVAIIRFNSKRLE